MTRFETQGPRIEYHPVESQKPVQQIIGLYNMWQSISPETKARIKNLFGLASAQEQLALRREDEREQRAADILAGEDKNNALRNLEEYKTGTEWDPASINWESFYGKP